MPYDPEDEEELQALLDDVQALFNAMAQSDTVDEEKLATLLAGLDLLADQLDARSLNY